MERIFLMLTNPTPGQSEAGRSPSATPPRILRSRHFNSRTENPGRRCAEYRYALPRRGVLLKQADSFS